MVNGVKQVGILSPFLFNIYVNELIELCLSLNLGSKLFEINTSMINFCDDLKQSYLMFVQTMGIVGKLNLTLKNRR